MSGIIGRYESSIFNISGLTLFGKVSEFKIETLYVAKVPSLELIPFHERAWYTLFTHTLESQ